MMQRKLLDLAVRGALAELASPHPRVHYRNVQFSVQPTAPSAPLVVARQKSDASFPVTKEAA